MYPVFVMVTEDENGSFATTGSDALIVTLGNSVTIATAPPIKVAAASDIPHIEILVLVFVAVFIRFFGLGSFRALFDIAIPALGTVGKLYACWINSPAAKYLNNLG